MKLKSLLGIVALIVLSAISLYSQDKVAEEQLGFGVEVNAPSSNEIPTPFGIHGVYALGPDMHLGAKLGFVFDSQSGSMSATTNLMLAPYFRYFLPKLAKSLKPFAEASFSFITGTFPNRSSNNPLDVTVSSKTYTSLRISAGAYWFPYSSVGVYGGIRFIDFHLDPTRVVAGIGQPFIGIDFWMDK